MVEENKFVESSISMGSISCKDNNHSSSNNNNYDADDNSISNIQSINMLSAKALYEFKA